VAGVSGIRQEFLAPESLGPDHDRSRFSNEVHPSLDQWLRERARSSEGLSARTYVVCTAAEPLRVAGYFAISTALEERIALPSARLRRGMPAKVPLLLIGRLAVDARFQGKGLGSALLSDALQRCVAASGIVGARGVIAHAIDDAAVRFYEHCGFIRSQLGERVMLMPMETARSLLAG
jgi:GNAT superfamily N-acetyltransferase